MTMDGLNTPEFQGPMPEPVKAEPAKKDKRKKPLTNLELMVLNIDLRKENRALQKTLEMESKRLKRFTGSGFVPERKLLEWREKCFLIASQLDELRDAMRQVLHDVQTYPRRKNGDG